MKKIFLIIFILFAAAVYAEDDYPAGSQLNIDGSTLGWDNTAKKWRPLAVDANGNIQSGGTVIDNISVDTSNIETYLKKTDGENTVTITDLINSIGTDTKNIENKLKVDDKTVTDLINGIGTDTADIKTYLTGNIGSAVGGQTVLYVLNQILGELGNQYTLMNNVQQGVSDLTKTAQPSELRMQRISSIAASTATAISFINDANSTATDRVYVELRAIDPDTEFYIGLSNAVTDSNGRPVKGRILLNIPKTQSIYLYHANASAIDIQQTEGWR